MKVKREALRCDAWAPAPPAMEKSPSPLVECPCQLPQPGALGRERVNNGSVLFVMVWFFFRTYHFSFLRGFPVLSSFDFSRPARVHRFDSTSSYGLVVSGVIECI